MNILRRVKNAAHFILAVGANVLYGFPSKNLTVIGITGTDGKTTTASLMYHILKSNGKKAALISTIGATIDDERHETGFHVTTPSPYAIQKYLKIAKKKGCEYVVLEVTSHALDQYRVWGIDFAVGILTNITHEHLDYHKSYQKYVNAKLRLFENSKTAVINSDGEWFEYVLRKIPLSKIQSYSLHGAQKNDTTLLNLPFTVKTKLLGDFNLENILATCVASKILGIESKIVDRAIQTFDPPVGRQEIIETEDLRIVIDFAHTANSFERVLPALRKITTGRLIHIFGAAGERDRRKRPEMGKAASFYDDIIILTAEDPRSEAISSINAEIKEGIHGFLKKEITEEANNKSLFEIADRKKAIEFALGIGRKNDTIVITGKGHEKSMNYGNGEVEWSDQQAVKHYLKNT